MTVQVPWVWRNGKIAALMMLVPVTVGKIAAMTLVVMLAGRASAAPPASPSGALTPPPVAPGADNQGSPGSINWEIPTTLLTVHLTLAGSLQPLASEVLPPVDVSALPGAHIVLRRGVADHVAEGSEARLTGLCARASSAHWSSGLEGLAFDKLDELARHDLERRGVVDHFDSMPEVEDGNRFERHYVANGTLGLDKSKPRPVESAAVANHKVHVEGHHLVGFVGETADILVCSFSCIEAAGENAPVCPAALGSLRFHGPFVAPPRSTGLARWAAQVLRRPFVTLGFVVGALLLLVGLLLIVLPGQRTSALR